MMTFSLDLQGQSRTLLTNMCLKFPNTECLLQYREKKLGAHKRNQKIDSTGEYSPSVKAGTLMEAWRNNTRGSLNIDQSPFSTHLLSPFRSEI